MDAKLPECYQLKSGACTYCNPRKQKCSLTPVNPETGKPDRRKGAAQLQESNVEGTKGGIGKGKQRADDVPDTGTPEESGPIPSPLAGLSGLGSLTLESGASSASATGNTPSDSPAALSQPSPIEAPSSTLPPAPRARRSSRRSAGMSSFKLPVTAPTHHFAVAGFVAGRPSTSRLLTAPDRRASHPRSDASLASNDGSNLDRISALEKKQDELEVRQAELERKQEQLATKQDSLEDFVKEVVRRLTNTRE